MVQLRRKNYQSSGNHELNSIYSSSFDLRDPEKLKIEFERCDLFRYVTIERMESQEQFSSLGITYTVQAETSIDLSQLNDLIEFLMTSGYDISYEMGIGSIRVSFKRFVPKVLKRVFIN